MDYEHVTVGFTRHASKRAEHMPFLKYPVIHYAIDNWRLCTDHNGIKTMLTVVHAMLPAGTDRLIKYTGSVNTYLQSCYTASRLDQNSLDDLLGLAIEDHRVGYCVTTLEFLDDNGHKLSFQDAVKLFNETVHTDAQDEHPKWKMVGRTRWGNPCANPTLEERSTASTSASTSASASATILPGRPPHADNGNNYNSDDDVIYIDSYYVHIDSDDVDITPSDTDDQIAAPATETASVMDTASTSASDTPEDVSYTFDASDIISTFSISDFTPEDINAALNTPDDVSSSAPPEIVFTCIICYIESDLRLLSCGHVMCIACLGKCEARNITKCGICGQVWSHHRALIGSSVSKKVCKRCSHGKTNIMICGHATCLCSDRNVCDQCWLAPTTIHVFC